MDYELKEIISDLVKCVSLWHRYVYTHGTQYLKPGGVYPKEANLVMNQLVGLSSGIFIMLSILRAKLIRTGGELDYTKMVVREFHLDPTLRHGITTQTMLKNGIIESQQYFSEIGSRYIDLYAHSHKGDAERSYKITQDVASYLNKRTPSEEEDEEELK